MEKTSLICCLLFCCCVVYTSTSPIHRSKKSKRVYKEAEYDIALDYIPKQVQYFVKPNEYQQYEKQFGVIRELGEALNCKLHGNCNGEKREEIVKERERNVLGTKKTLSSMLNMPQDEGNYPRQAASAQDALHSPVSPELEQEQMSHFGQDPRYSQQSNAAKFGQQPQMDLKLPSPGNPSTESDMPVGMVQTGTAPVPSNTFLQMQNQQNDQTIQNAIQSKLSFMDQANRPTSMGDQAAGFPMKSQPSDESPGDSIGGPHGMANTESSSVSENDILNAEGIQPNEMNDLHNFLKNSNEVNSRANANAEMTDGKFNDFSGPAPDSTPSSDSGPNSGPPSPVGLNENGLENLEKTNVDFGSHPHIDNEEGGFGRQNTGRMPLRPGTPEVPVLNNLLGGPTPDNPGPDAPPNVQFVEQNAKDMMQTNSDYQVPNSAFSNLWKDYMTSTQSQLGQDDPSANSRDEIIGHLKSKKISSQLHRWKKSDVTLRQ